MSLGEMWQKDMLCAHRL